MNNWPQVRIRDVSEKITVGFVGSMSKYFVDSGVPLLRGLNIRPFSLKLTNLKYIPLEIHEKWRKSSLKEGDVVIVRVGYPGVAAVIPSGLGPLNAASLVIVRTDKSQLDPTFLANVLNSPWGKAIVQGRLVGAAQQVFNTNTVADLEIPFPPFPIQRRIAAILSTYDDLIENNTRRIAILEEMARRLYEEWFVHFRFPGHEGVGMVESEIGEVPEGWEVSRVENIAQLKSGYAFKSKTFSPDGPYKLVTIKNVHDGRFVGHCESRLDDVPDNMPVHCHLRTGDFLLSLTGNVGRVCVVQGGDFLLNQRVAKIVPAAPQLRAFSYLMFRDRTFRSRLENLATGVAQQNLSPVKTEQLRALLPAETVLEQFSELVEPILEACSVLDRTNTNLRTQRDLLLPRLISGDIDVSEVGEPIVEVAAA